MASRGSSSRRKNIEGKNTQSSNKETQYDKEDAEVTNTDVRQCVPSTGPSKNDVEQCTPACAEPSKSKIESRSTEQESLISYVQNLSPLKRNRRNFLDYPSTTLQTASGNREVLLYSPPKRSHLLESEKSRRPIKVSCLTSTSDRKKLIINDMTKVSFPDREDICLQTLLLLFKYANHKNKRSFVSTANEALVGTLMTIGDVNNIFPIVGSIPSSLKMCAWLLQIRGEFYKF